MARSAGNLATEICVAMMQRYGEMENIDLYKLLHFIDSRLMPAMQKENAVSLVCLTNRVDQEIPFFIGISHRFVMDQAVPFHTISYKLQRNIIADPMNIIIIIQIYPPAGR